MINKFRGKYYFLSNFYNSPVIYEGVKYLNNEAAFQSCKTLDIKKRKDFSQLDPSSSKRKGRHLVLRNDWEKVKYNIMYEIVLAKFTQNTELKKKLLDTDNEYLEEGNTWNDTTWGVCNGRGKNMLGKILMKVRDEIRENNI